MRYGRSLRAKGLKDVIGLGNAVERVDGTGVARVEFKKRVDRRWMGYNIVSVSNEFTIVHLCLIITPGSKIHVCFQN